MGHVLPQSLHEADTWASTSACVISKATDIFHYKLNESCKTDQNTSILTSQEAPADLEPIPITEIWRSAGASVAFRPGIGETRSRASKPVQGQSRLTPKPM